MQKQTVPGIRIKYQKKIGEKNNRSIHFFKAYRSRPLPSASAGVEVMYGTFTTQSTVSKNNMWEDTKDLWYALFFCVLFILPSIGFTFLSYMEWVILYYSILVCLVCWMVYYCIRKLL